MWSKILSVINSLLIILVACFGYFVYQENSIQQQRSQAENKEILQALKQTQELQAELMKNPVIALGLTPNNTLDYTDGKLVGFVDLDIVLANQEETVAELEDPLEILIVGYKNETDESLNEFFEAELASSTKYFENDNEYKYLPLGCLINESSEGIEISPTDYEKLASSEATSLKARLYFGGKAVSDSENVCDGVADKLQILN